MNDLSTGGKQFQSMIALAENNMDSISRRVYTFIDRIYRKNIRPVIVVPLDGPVVTSKNAHSFLYQKSIENSSEQQSNALKSCDFFIKRKSEKLPADVVFNVVDNPITRSEKDFWGQVVAVILSGHT